MINLFRIRSILWTTQETNWKLVFYKITDKRHPTLCINMFKLKWYKYDLSVYVYGKHHDRKSSKVPLVQKV